MAEEVRVWEVGGADQLTEIGRAELQAVGEMKPEKRLENWVEADISVVDPTLLVIGRQVPTAFGKLIDLLCMDRSGNLVIVELKRDLTPRDVTAQTLDYASWVKDLGAEEIEEIAGDYFKKRGTDLESAFRTKFNVEFSELEVINEHHAMRVVASELDDGTERIIRYLSETYGADINAALFQFFKTKDNRELLVRTFTVPHEEAETNIKKRPGKRLPPPTPKEMEQAADTRGVGALYRSFEKALAPLLHATTTRTTLSFDAPFPDDSRRVLFNIVPGESNSEQGLRYRVYSKRLAQLLGADENTIKSHLPRDAEHWQYGPSAPIEYHGLAGYIRTEDEIRKIAELMRRALKTAGAAV